MRLAGKNAIITGAASGIGHATAQLFVAEGAHVLAVDMNEHITQAHSGHENIITLCQDITADKAAQHIIKTAIDAFGTIDILLNNAGIGGGAPAENMSRDLWEHVMKTNATAPFHICQAAIPYLKHSSAGRIINIASIMATHTDFGLAAYSAAKAAITGFTRNLALELGTYNITANSILPGAIFTGMTKQNFSNADIAAIWARKSPLNRLGQPIDIAYGALFLASDEGGFVTGHNLNIDGGMMLRT